MWTQKSKTGRESLREVGRIGKSINQVEPVTCPKEICARVEIVAIDF